MKTKSIILFTFLAVFLLTAFASAVSITLNTATPISANHNTDVTVSFNLTNDDAFNYTGFSFSGSTCTNCAWTLFQPSSQTLEVGSNLTISATLHINQYASSATPTLIVNASNNTASSIGSQAVGISVNATPSLSISQLSQTTKYQNGSIKITNTGNTNLGTITLSSSGAANVSFSSTKPSAPAPGEDSSAITISPQDPDSLKFGLNTVTIYANASDGTSTSSNINIEKSFCSKGAAGSNLSIKSIDISNDGDDDTSWKPLDTVTVKVKFENNGNDRVRKVYVKLGLFDHDGKDQTGELDFINSGDEKIKYGTLKEGDDDRVTFEFKVPPSMDEGDYKLAIKVYSDDEDEDNTCDDASSDLNKNIYQEIDVEREDNEDRYIAFGEELLSPKEAVCGDITTLSFKAYNVGTEDQDRVRIHVKNTDLELNQTQDLTRGLDIGDSEDLSFNFVVPQGLSDKTYKIEVYAEYGYDSNDDFYGLESNPSYFIPFKVFGCNVSATKVASISASMVSEKALVGKELEIKTTISNIQTSNATFVIAAKNYGSWADLNSISETTFTLAPGQSKEVTLKFDVNNDIDAGEYSFDLEATSNSKTDTREIALNIEKPSLLSSIIPSSLKDNALFWVIGIVNLILIILIIVVAVKLARR